MFALLDYWPQSILNMGVKGGGEVVRDFVHPPSGDAADSSDVGSSPRGCAEIIEKRLPQAEASVSTSSVMFAAEQANSGCLCRFSQ